MTRALRWWLAITAVLLVVAGGLFAMSWTEHAPTQAERRWRASLASLHLTPDDARRLAAEARRAPRPGAAPTVADEVAVLHDDVARMAALRYVHVVEDAQTAHAGRWRRRAAWLAGLAGLVLLLGLVQRLWPERPELADHDHSAP